VSKHRDDQGEIKVKKFSPDGSTRIDRISREGAGGRHSHDWINIDRRKGRVDEGHRDPDAPR
jgi:hypothetical protein